MEFYSILDLNQYYNRKEGRGTYWPHNLLLFLEGIKLKKLSGDTVED